MSQRAIDLPVANQIFASSSKATFTVHVDEETSSSAPSLTTPFKLSSTKALTARKHVEEQDNIAVALFEPPNPMVKPMYCKHLVYQVRAWSLCNGKQ